VKRYSAAGTIALHVGLGSVCVMDGQCDVRHSTLVKQIITVPMLYWNVGIYNF